METIVFPFHFLVHPSPFQFRSNSMEFPHFLPPPDRNRNRKKPQFVPNVPKSRTVHQSWAIAIGHGSADGSGGFFCLSSLQSNQLQRRLARRRPSFLFASSPLVSAFPRLCFNTNPLFRSWALCSTLLCSADSPKWFCFHRAGIILGPSFLGCYSAFASKVFPVSGINVIETFSIFGLMLFIFQVGVKMDPMVMVKLGKKALAIGILSFVLPNAMARFTAYVLKDFLSLDKEVSNVLSNVAMLLSMTSFPVVACFLAELEILNSEIGRLACSSSMVCDICYWSVISFKIILTSVEEMSPQTFLGSLLSNALLISLIVFGICPGALWVVQNSPEGKPVKEIYIFAVFVALLICGFLGEVTDLTAFSTSFFLGLAIPDGPPLGAALSDWLDCFVSVLLMPIFFTDCGLRINIFSIQKLENVGVFQLVVFVALFGKVVGAILPSLLCRMPFRDALALGLVLNWKGTIELVVLIGWKVQNVMNDESFTIMIVSVVLETGFISTLVKAICNPSMNFIAYKRRTILHLRNDDELRILTCIHGLENAQPILDLLLISNPTHESPIHLVVLHLIKLAGRSSPLLIAHQPRERSFSYKTQSEQIFSVFRKLEERFGDRIRVNFYKDASYDIRQLNKNVLDKAPCTVGVLIDNGNLRSSYNFSRLAFHRVVVLFFGGADDREALAFAARMSEHDKIPVTLFRFSSSNEIVGSTARSKMLDTKLLSEFKLKSSQNNRLSCQDKVVKDGDALVSVLKSLESAYDLVMVGRQLAESWLMSMSGDRTNSRKIWGLWETFLLSITIAGHLYLWCSSRQDYGDCATLKSRCV